jgi:glycosyltransferase involved in cell wall biosynthesis
VNAPWPRLSVLLPNFNHARFLRDSIPALLRHPEIPAEVIIIDDASTDDSVRVLEELTAGDSRVQLHRNAQNAGVLANLDQLLSMATCEYVYCAASDDLVLPTFFERSLALLARHPQAGLCSTLTWMIDGDGVKRAILPAPFISRGPTYLPPDRVRSILLSVGAWFQGNTAVHRREALLDAGGYRPELESFTDSFVAQVSALRNGACFIPEPLTAWRLLPDTYSRGVLGSESRRTAMVAHAVELMQGHYRNDFPPGYAHQWKNEMLFKLSWTAAAELRARRAATAGALIAWLEWCLRLLMLLPTAPPHVVRRKLMRLVR